MSISKNPQQLQSEPGGPPAPHPSTSPGAGGTVSAESSLKDAVQEARKLLRKVFILTVMIIGLGLVWYIIHDAISRARDSDMKERLENESEFKIYLGPTEDLEPSLEDACEYLKKNFHPEDDDDQIKKNLGVAWVWVYWAISSARDSYPKERLRSQPEFNAYVMPGSYGERELTKLLRSMAKQELPWSDIFKNGPYIAFSLLTSSALIITFYLQRHLSKLEPEKTDPIRGDG